MYYCYSGLFDSEAAYAKDLGVYLFYDNKKKLFLDQNDKIIDIKNKDIFIRTGMLQYDEVITAVMENGGKPLTTKQEHDKIVDWPKYIKTSRKNILLSGKEIIDNAEIIINKFKGERLFFKTKIKNYSQIISKSDLTDKNSILYKAILEHQSAHFIISDPVNIIEDEYGIKEYRCFVVAGKILNISRVHNLLLEKIPRKFLEKANLIIKELQTKDFPDTFVLDLFEY